MAREPAPSRRHGSGPPQGPHALWPPGARLRQWGPYLIIAILIIGTLLDIPSYLQKWLWMRQLGFLEIFWTLLTVQWGMFLLGFVSLSVLLVECTTGAPHEFSAALDA